MGHMTDAWIAWIQAHTAKHATPAAPASLAGKAPEWLLALAAVGESGRPHFAIRGTRILAPGEMVIEPQYGTPQDFSEGRAVMRQAR